MSQYPDQKKWNERFRSESHFWGFEPAPVFEEAVTVGIPDGTVLELACGMSGNALVLAEAGREVLAVDVSDVALGRLQAEAKARGVAERITCVQADLSVWCPPEGQSFALVLCVMYWDRKVFDYAWPVVQPGGLIAWQAFTSDQVKYRPSIRPEICLGKDEPASLLPSNFTVITEQDIDDGQRAVRRVVARREV